MARDLHLKHIHIATDYLTVVNNLKSGYLGRCFPILQDIRELKTEFEEVHILHEKREHVWEAHELAKSSVTLGLGRHLLLLHPPDFMYLPLLASIE